MGKFQDMENDYKTLESSSKNEEKFIFVKDEEATSNTDEVKSEKFLIIGEEKDRDVELKESDTKVEEVPEDMNESVSDESTLINNEEESEDINEDNSEESSITNNEEESEDANESISEKSDENVEDSLNENISISNLEKNNDIVNELDGIDIRKMHNNQDFNTKKDTKKVPRSIRRKKENSYIKRVISNFILLVIIVMIFSYSLYKSLDFNKEHTIKYNEGSNIDYKVYLKDNDFYDRPYLNKNMMYVANLVKNIEVDFNYNFNIEENTSMNFIYDIVGDLIIRDESEENILGEKSYSLLDNKNIKMTNQTGQTIKETVTIDYDYYNEIANKFKADYEINTKSYLKVTLKVAKRSSEEVTTYKIDDTKDLSITIPLSQKAINIKMDSEEISGEEKVISSNNISNINITFIILTILSFIIMMIIFTKLIKLILLLVEKESKYDKYINKLLSQYDRLIVETTHIPDFNDFNIIKINKFTELLDVRDNLKLPIMFYEVVKHHKANFYIKHNNDIYLYTAKETDI